MSDERFQWWSDRVAATGLALYGRRLWEGMSSPWPTAGRWRDMPKVVFSSTTTTVDWNARLVTGDAVAEITSPGAESVVRVVAELGELGVRPLH